MRWWGRPQHYATVYPPVSDVPRRVVLAMAFVALVSVALYRYVVVWTPLQCAYLSTYVRSLLWGDAEFHLLYIVDGKSHRLALDQELVLVTSTTGETTFALAETTAKTGTTRLEWQRARYPNVVLYAFLRRWIYRDQTPLDLFLPPLWTALVLFLGGVIGIRMQRFDDARLERERRLRWGAPPQTVVVDQVAAASSTRAPLQAASRPSQRPGLPATTSGSRPPEWLE